MAGVDSVQLIEVMLMPSEMVVARWLWMDVVFSLGLEAAYNRTALIIKFGPFKDSGWMSAVVVNAVSPLLSSIRHLSF